MTRYEIIVRDRTGRTQTLTCVAGSAREAAATIRNRRGWRHAYIIAIREAA